MSRLILKAPETETEWQLYDDLAFKVLRAPWDQDRLPREPASENLIPALALDDQNTALGVARLEKTGDAQWQLRQMAVSPEAQGTGLGKLLVGYLEQRAKEAGGNEIILHAREKAVGFYEKLGYEVVKPSYLLFDLIPHFLMHKPI